jgi:DnaK suppressor protein
MARREALLRLNKSLHARRAELRKRLGMELEDLRSTTDAASQGDSADAAFGASGEEVSTQLAEMESRELAQIDRAIDRLKTGAYGHCEICECKIPVLRLNALPYSTLCIECQREAELDPTLLGDRLATGWDRLSDRDSFRDREVKIRDLEYELPR